MRSVTLPTSTPGAVRAGCDTDAVPGEQLLDVRGGPLAVDDPGGPNPPLVWSHGLTSSRQHEDDTGLFPWSSLADVRVIRYDARGHGRSGGPPDERAYVWQSLGLDLLDVMIVTGVDRAAIGGASMGCASALFAAMSRPEAVDRLVLAIPPTVWESRAPSAELNRDGAAVVETQGLGTLVEFLRAQPPLGMLGDDAARARDLGADSVARMDADLLPHILRGAAASDLPDPERVAEITQPALVLAWTGDRTHPISSAERLVDVLPDAELVVADDRDAIREWPARVAAFVTG